MGLKYRISEYKNKNGTSLFFPPKWLKPNESICGPYLTLEQAQEACRLDSAALWDAMKNPPVAYHDIEVAEHDL